EIDAAIRREVEDEPRAVERLFDAGELHPEAALADLEQRDAKRFLFAPLMLEARNDVVARGEANDALRRVPGRAALIVELWQPAHDRPERLTAVGVHDDAIAGARRTVAVAVGRQKRLRAPDWAQLDGDER